MSDEKKTPSKSKSQDLTEAESETLITGTYPNPTVEMPQAAGIFAQFNLNEQKSISPEQINALSQCFPADKARVLELVEASLQHFHELEKTNAQVNRQQVENERLRIQAAMQETHLAYKERASTRLTGVGVTFILFGGTLTYSFFHPGWAGMIALSVEIVGFAGLTIAGTKGKK